MITDSYTFCALIQLGEFYFSEMKYTVVFSFYNYFLILLSSMVYLFWGGHYYSDRKIFSEQIVKYLNKITIGSANINNFIHRVTRLHSLFFTEYCHVLFAFASYLHA